MKQHLKPLLVIGQPIYMYLQTLNTNQYLIAQLSMQSKIALLKFLENLMN